MSHGASPPMLDIGPRIGCDVVDVADIGRSIELFGNRYLDRTFTPHELQTCVGANRAQRLAARFAAKESVVKVLRPGDVALPWKSIEIVRASWGGCAVKLSGPAADLARVQDLHDFQVSISHEAGVAIAMVIAIRSSVRNENEGQHR